MFVFAIVVDKDNSATDVCVLADKCIANVGKVACLYTALQGAVFDFHKVAHSAVVLHDGVISQVGIGADCTILPHIALHNARAFYNGVCADGGIDNVAKTAHNTTIAQNCVALYYGKWLDCDVVAHFDGWFQNVLHRHSLIE